MIDCERRRANGARTNHEPPLAARRASVPRVGGEARRSLRRSLTRSRARTPRSRERIVTVRRARV